MVRYIFDTGVGGLRRNVRNSSVLNHEGQPMDITQAGVSTRVCTRAVKKKLNSNNRRI